MPFSFSTATFVKNESSNKLNSVANSTKLMIERLKTEKPVDMCATANKT
jgi:hypothetical protein